MVPSECTGKPYVVNMKVGNKNIGLIQIDAQLLQAGVHGIQALFTVKAGVNDQKPVSPFDDV